MHCCCYAQHIVLVYTTKILDQKGRTGKFALSPLSISIKTAQESCLERITISSGPGGRKGGGGGGVRERGGGKTEKRYLTCLMGTLIVSHVELSVPQCKAADQNLSWRMRPCLIGLMAAQRLSDLGAVMTQIGRVRSRRPNMTQTERL